MPECAAQRGASYSEWPMVQVVYTAYVFIAAP